MIVWLLLLTAGVAITVVNLAGARHKVDWSKHLIRGDGPK